MRTRQRLLLLVLGLLALGTAVARHHRRDTEGGEPGEFAYYVLSLSWSPAFCLDSPGKAECGGPRRFGFIAHGLWPQNESGWPQNCDVHAAVPDSVVNDLQDVMPARGLIYHEWKTHGTCSGLDPQAYFALLKRAYGEIHVPASLKDVGQPIERAPQAVHDDFVRANPALPAAAVAVLCTSQSTPRLREVHVCLDRDLKARACSSQVLKQACRAPTLIVPPIR
jgi:ribonuclease T2